MKKIIFLLSFSVAAIVSLAQVPGRPPKKIMLDDVSSPMGQESTGNDQQYDKYSTSPRKDTISFEHRDDSKDSISIFFRYLDSTRKAVLDSSVDDFDKYYSVSSRHAVMGNNGSATYSLIFQPNASIGFDPGLHAYDVYNFTLESTRFYRSTKPYSLLSYQLASGKEQMMKASHTQNPKPNFNWGFDYRLISAPGFFVTQNTNHNNLRLFGNFQSNRKRYNNWFALISNNIRASENGGVESVVDLYDPNRKNRFTVPVNLGNSAAYQPNPFITTVLTGNQYRSLNLFLRQSYDFGKRDSVAINDSTTEYLFYPKLRVQHSLTYTERSFQFGDVAPDSALYENWYQININSSNDTFLIRDKWKIVNNDLSLIQYPDTKNQSQFLLGGITVQHISGAFTHGKEMFYNLWAHAEYRNRTRNKLWDMLLKGELYFSGLNSGDFSSYGTIGRYVNKKLGFVQIYFKNINKSPSFIYDVRSSFHLGDTFSFKKENQTSFGISINNSFINLSFNNHLLLNHLYFKDKFQAVQYDNPINLIQFSGSKKIKLSKRWNWYAEATIQQTDGASPIRVPLIFARNRIAFEGRFFKNLQLSTGIEARYFSPFKANGYSPVIGQFYTQDSVTINNLPDLNVFLHYRIRGFAGYLRFENINTASFKNGFSFTNNNFAAPFYPTPGFMIRFGIQWSFVN